MSWDSREPGPEIAAETFLSALWPGDELPGDVVLSGHPSWRSRWLSPGDPAEVAKVSREWGKRENVYFALALQDQARAFEAKRRKGGTPTPENTRGAAESAAAIGCVWAEIDTTDGDHKATNLPNMEEAFDLIDALPIAPSALVLSGGGIHAYWFLRELLTIGDGNRGEVARLVLGWQEFLRERLKAKGWKLDEVHDLARVLRPPETLNHKYDPPRPVRVDLFEPFRRYNSSDFEPYIPTGIETPVVPQGEDDGVRLDAAEALKLSGILLERALGRIAAGEARHIAARWTFLQAADNRIPQDIARALVEPLTKAAEAKGGGRPIDAGEFSRVLSWAYGKPRRAPWATVAEKLERLREIEAEIAEPATGTPAPVPTPLLLELTDALALNVPRDPVAFGIVPLDECLGGGIAEGEALVIGGGPGSFKTTKVAYSALRLATPKTAVLFVAADEPSPRVARKIGSQAGEWYSELTSEYPPVLTRLRGKLADREAFFRITHPHASFSLEDPLEAFNREAPKARQRIVIVDHLHSVVTRDAADDDTEKSGIEKVVRVLVDGYARARGWSVIALSEVTKAALTPAVGEAPMMAFAGSRKIVSRFDAAFLMVPEGDRRVRVIPAKNRFGSKVPFTLEWDVVKWAPVHLADDAIEADRAAAKASRAAEAEAAQDAAVLLAVRKAIASGSPLKKGEVPDRVRLRACDARKALARLLEAGVLKLESAPARGSAGVRPLLVLEVNP